MPQIEQIFIERLRRTKDEYSHDSLARPKDKTEFGYGQASGKYLGLCLAEQLFNEVIGEEDDGT